jgi:hypothetical protein
METAIRELMGAGTPPRFKFKDTYASIEFPVGYTVPAQATLEAKYDELLALEEDIQKTVVEGDLEVGTSNLFVDTQTGNVGIGTTNPGVKLELEATNPKIRLTDNRLNTATDGLELGAIEWFSREASLPNDYDPVAKIAVHVSDTSVAPDGEIRFSTGINGTLTERLILMANGNVGIGTPSPAVKLDVAGSSNSGKSLQLRSGDSSSGTDSSQIIFSFNNNPYNSSGYAHSIRTRHDSGSNNGNAIDFWLWNTTDTTDASTLGNKRVMTIEGNGNVGIGTTSPTYNLDVNGSFGAKNKGWYITGGGGNAGYNGASPNKNYFAYNVNNTVYGSSVTTYNGASSSAWRSNDGVFTYPEAGLYQVTIHMFINGTSNGRYGVFKLNDSGGTNRFSQYMYFTPSNYGSNYQRSWTTFVRVESGWQSYMQPEGGSITLYLADQHTCLLIDKIC